MSCTTAFVHEMASRRTSTAVPRISAISLRAFWRSRLAVVLSQCSFIVCNANIVRENAIQCLVYDPWEIISCLVERGSSSLQSLRLLSAKLPRRHIGQLKGSEMIDYPWTNRRCLFGESTTSGKVLSYVNSRLQYWRKLHEFKKRKENSSSKVIIWDIAI